MDCCHWPRDLPLEQLSFRPPLWLPVSPVPKHVLEERPSLLCVPPSCSGILSPSEWKDLVETIQQSVTDITNIISLIEVSLKIYSCPCQQCLNITITVCSCQRVARISVSCELPPRNFGGQSLLSGRPTRVYGLISLPVCPVSEPSFHHLTSYTYMYLSFPFLPFYYLFP